MTQKIYIIGAGGFGREVQWLIERINQAESQWMIEGYVDDNVKGCINDYPVVGTLEDFQKMCAELSEKVAVVCAIGNAHIRESVINRLRAVENICFPNLIDPSVIMSERIKFGEGNIICAGNILTVNICIGNFNIINLDCTIGHDVVTGDYVTLYPSVNISGAVTLGQGAEIGTGAHVIQGLSIGDSSIIGAGSVVIRDIPANCTAVGNPCRVIKANSPK